MSTNLTGLRDKLLTLKDVRVFKEILTCKYYPQSVSDEEINISSELDKINAPSELRNKINDLLISKQKRTSNVSMLQSTELLNSSATPVTNIPEVRAGLLRDDKLSRNLAETNDILGLTEHEICSVFGEQSLKNIIQQFSPLISEVFKNFESFKAGNTASMANKLGVSLSDLQDLFRGKQTTATLPIFMKLIASIYWAMSHSSLLSGESKFLLPFNNGKSKLQFDEKAKNIKIFLPNDLKLMPFEMLQVDIDVSLHAAQYIEFVQNTLHTDLLISTTISQPPWHNFSSLIVQ